LSNIFDYLAWRGDLGFSHIPFNPVDNIILSQLSYLPLDGIVPSPEEKRGISIAEAAEIFEKNLAKGKKEFKNRIMHKEDPHFIKTLGASARFGNCELFGYINNVDPVQEKQMSCFSVLTGDGFCFVVYRGTDLTFIGWKESINMGFNDIIPAQLDAVAYLEKIAGLTKKPLRVGGHSKGGNLAIFASAFCSPKVRKRIKAIYSNDAPGFHKKVIQSDGFNEIRERIASFVPQSSVVGMLLEHGEYHSVVKSSKIGLLQHDLYSWEVTYSKMVQVDGVTKGSLFVDKTLREWVENLNYDQRQRFIEVLFEVLSASNVKSFYELSSDWFKTSRLMLRSIKNIDKPTKDIIQKTMTTLLKSAKNNIETLLPPLPRIK